MRRAALVLSLVGALAAGACGHDGPRGPGSFDGKVRASVPSVGAVIVEITGPGLQGVEGAGTTRAFAALQSGAGEDGLVVYRAVLVNETPGDLDFVVEVAELADGAPTAVVVDAVDGENQPIGSLGSFSVNLTR